MFETRLLPTNEMNLLCPNRSGDRPMSREEYVELVQDLCEELELGEAGELLDRGLLQVDDTLVGIEYLEERDEIRLLAGLRENEEAIDRNAMHGAAAGGQPGQHHLLSTHLQRAPRERPSRGGVSHPRVGIARGRSRSRIRAHGATASLAGRMENLAAGRTRHCAIRRRSLALSWNVWPEEQEDLRWIRQALGYTAHGHLVHRSRGRTNNIQACGHCPLVPASWSPSRRRPRKT